SKRLLRYLKSGPGSGGESEVVFHCDVFLWYLTPKSYFSYLKILLNKCSPSNASSSLWQIIQHCLLSLSRLCIHALDRVVCFGFQCVRVSVCVCVCVCACLC